jgi:hypothetical protein
MTITSTQNRVSYAGNGAPGVPGTLVFAVPFRFLATSDLVVLVRVDATGVSTTMGLDTAYSVAGEGAATGGTVTFLIEDGEPQTGETLIIYGNPAMTQLVDYISGGTFPAESHEEALDRLTLQSTRTREIAERSLSLTDSSTDGSGEYNANSNRISSLGTPTATTDATTKVYVDALVNTTIGPIPTSDAYVTSTGSVTSRKLADRWGEAKNVKDYGAVGDGVADDTAEIQAAINAAGTNGHVYIPAGTFMLSDSLTVFDRRRITGDGGASILKMITGSTMTMPAMLQLPNTAGTDGWLTGTAYALQDFRFNPATFETYVCIAAGNSGATVPTGTGDVSDGVCQWRYLYTSAAAGNSTNLTNRSHYDGFVCHGNSVARFGISGLVNHTSFVGLWMLATTEAGIRIGYGWCNYLERVESSFNTGDGIHLVGSSNNATTLNSCKVFANTGKGIYIVGYNALKIVNCTVEANRKTGIDVQQGGSGLSIDNCYFEANAQDGITYSNGGVDVNVKADIILNGTSATAELGRAYPSQGVTISDCFVNALYDNGATNGHPFVMAAAVQGLTLRGNAANTSTVVPYLMGTPGNTSPTSVSGSYGSAESVTAVNNVDFAGALDVAVVGNGLGLSAAWAADHRVDTVESRNIAVSNLGLWSLLTASAGGTFARSAEVFTPAPELPVWELVWATAGGSHLFGYTLDAADFSEFHGKQMLIGCWTRHAFSGDGNAAPYFAIDATSFALTQSNSSVNTWVKWFWSFKMPETGIHSLRVRCQRGPAAIPRQSVRTDCGHDHIRGQR